MSPALKKILIVVLLLNSCIISLYISSMKFPETLRFLDVRIPQFEDAVQIPWQQSAAWTTYLESLDAQNSDLNIMNDDLYCVRVAEYRKNNTLVFDDRGVPRERAIYTDYQPIHLARQVMRKYGDLKHSMHFIAMNLSMVPIIHFDPSITAFVELLPNWHQFHKIGTHFLCEGQRYNHIPGNDWLNFKDVVAETMRDYAKYYNGREHCFDPWQIMPHTLNLVNSEQCKAFKDELEINSYSKGVHWMLKKSRFSHNGKGITIVNQALAKDLLETLECPSKELKLAQKYIQEPLLINGSKFDFRAYMVIGSMDPLMIWYHDGFIKISLDDYDPNSNDLNVHLTNTILAENSVKNKTKEEKESILNDQSWDFAHFEKYMKEYHSVDDDWMDTHVRDYIKQVMFHMVRMNLDKLLKHPRVYELYGLDFLMDSNMHLWFIETNLTPSIGSTSTEKTKVNVKMFKDLLDLQYAIQFEGDVDRIFERTNYHWIYDGRKMGYARYQNLISYDCI